jgi:hypothetical protein
VNINIQNIVKVNACRCYSRDLSFKQKSKPFKDAIYLQEIAALCNNLRYPNILPIRRFAERIFCRRTFRRTDILPNGDILTNGLFADRSPIFRRTGSIPNVVRQTFQLARCGCTLRVTSQTSYSPEYT